jgi:hypothetical protein
MTRTRTRIRDLVALLAILLLLGTAWLVARAEDARNHATSGTEPVRELWGRELPRWWPIDWPPATQMRSWVSTPGSNPPPIKTR